MHLPTLILTLLSASLLDRALAAEVSESTSSSDSIATTDSAASAACPFTIPNVASLTVAQICAALNLAAPDQVFYPGEPEYVAQSYHYFLQDAIVPTCMVEPKTSTEVSILMQIINKFKPQWALRGRGHNHNPGFSGTTGLLISTAKFTSVTINNNNNTVSAGTGLRATDVYNAVAHTGKTIIGGRTKGPGIGGVTLGGGMSWLVNEHGLAIDGLDSAELVTPTGAIKQLSATQNTDLWWAIRGGGNRFGIVTRMTFTLYPIGNVCGGTYIIGADGNKTLIYEAGKRLAEFDAQNTDPKASINWVLILNPGAEPLIVLNYFYNAPVMPASTFAMFFSLPNIPQLSFAATNMPYNEFLDRGEQPQYNRSCETTVPIRRHTQTYVKTAIDLFYDVITTSRATGKSLSAMIWVFEPFVSTWISHSKGGAWPHETDPTSAPVWYLIWDNPTDDTYFQNKMRSLTTIARNQALSEGIVSTTSPLYSNYLSVTQGTPEQVYQQNLPRLKQIFAANDPNHVMDLTAGWNLR